MSYPDIPPKLSETIPGSLLLHEEERKKQKKGPDPAGKRSGSAVGAAPAGRPAPKGSRAQRTMQASRSGPTEMYLILQPTAFSM